MRATLKNGECNAGVVQASRTLAHLKEEPVRRRERVAVRPHVAQVPAEHSADEARAAHGVQHAVHAGAVQAHAAQVEEVRAGTCAQHSARQPFAFAGL